MKADEATCRSAMRCVHTHSTCTCKPEPQQTHRSRPSAGTAAGFSGGCVPLARSAAALAAPRTYTASPSLTRVREACAARTANNGAGTIVYHKAKLHTRTHVHAQMRVNLKTT